jgi:hypothetical protein
MVLAIARCGPSRVPSKCDLHEDTLRLLLNARVNTLRFTAVEILAIHSRRVEPALIQYVITPLRYNYKQTTVQFFFFFFWCFGRKVTTTIVNHTTDDERMHAFQENRK